MALAEGRPTKDPLLSQILFTRRINHYLGVQLWPGELEDLPQDFMDAVKGLMDGVPKMAKHFDEVEKHFEKFRQAHPTYKKKR